MKTLNVAIIGYEHTLVHAVADFLAAIRDGRQITPNFLDGMREMQIIDAGIESARTGRKVAVAEIA